jgi:hypothetical protein
VGRKVCSPLRGLIGPVLAQTRAIDLLVHDNGVSSASKNAENAKQFISKISNVIKP